MSTNFLFTSKRDSGWIKVTNVTYGSNVSYGCQKGFNLRGFASRFCQANGTWSGNAPQCEVVNCGEPFPVAHASLIFSSTTYGSAVEYYCENSYKLIGPVQRLCGPDGQWNNSKPSCKQIQCSELPSITNGHVTLNGTSLGDSATYTCNPGFELTSLVTRICQSDELWSETEPQCQPITCAEVTLQLQNGSIIGQSTTYGSILQYECSSGYRLIGSSSRTCLEDAKWSGDEPFCKQITCPKPEALNNGEVHGENFFVASLISYSCHQGYKLLGEKQRACLKDGNWTYKKPTCILITCPLIGPIKNGKAEISSINFNESVSYFCNPGYYLEGPSSRVCQENGSWSENDPHCLRTLCPFPVPIPNGSYIGNDTAVGAVLKIVCNSGYFIEQEASVITCGINGEWLATNGECHKVHCSPVSDFQFGSVIGSDFSYGSIIRFQCDINWQLIGDRAVICTESGRWNSTLPICVGTTCPHLEPVANSKALTNIRTYGTTILYECLPGYKIIGQANRTCSVDNKWTGEPPRCDPVLCPKPLPVKNAKLHGNLYSFSSTITYVCDIGFQMVGNEQLTCSEDSRWSSNEPICIKISCPLPESFQHGYILQKSKYNVTLSVFDGEVEELFYYADNIFNKCEEGYNLEGSATRSCQTNGTWSGIKPSCHPQNCGQILQPEHGSVTYNGTTYNAVAIHECDKGYVLKGPKFQECLVNGLWSTSPFCRMVECPRPQIIPYGSVNWTGLHFGSVVTYSCATSYRLEGVALRTCREDGQWSYSEPHCKIIECRPLQKVKNGMLHFTSHYSGSVATHSCEVGYVLVGNPVSTCLTNSSWSNIDVRCIPEQCTKPQEIKHGVIYYTNLTVGSSIHYSCEEGFVLEGNSEQICLPKQTWSGPSPLCIPLRCKPPSVPVHAQLEVNKLSVGGIAMYICNDGYLMKGSPKLTCTISGNWSSAAPTCHIIKCPPVRTVSNGNVYGSSFTYRSVLYFECQRNYRLKGHNEIHCTKFGTWSHEIPTCQRYLCFSLPVGDHVVWLQPSDAYTFGSIARYSCSLGFTPAANNTYHCDSDGVWYGLLPPRCQMIQCGHPPIVANSIQNISKAIQYSVGSIVNFICADDYMLYGGQSMVCHSDGQWHGRVPECRKQMTCQPPTAWKNSFYYMHKEEFRINDVVEMMCHRGFRPSGSMTVTCRNNGLWTPASGICLPDNTSGSCAKKCLNGGSCVSWNRCHCPTGYTGRFCQQPICILPCLNGGTCIAPYQCLCRNNYSGSRCQHRIQS